MDTSTPPPSYSVSEYLHQPPEYTPSVRHLSLVYLIDETHNDYMPSRGSPLPLLFEINSTQINFYNLKPQYARIVAYLFNDLNSSLVDPNLNVKSSKPYSKLNVLGHGIGSSTNLFSNFSCSDYDLQTPLSLQSPKPTHLSRPTSRNSSFSSISSIFSSRTQPNLPSSASLASSSSSTSFHAQKVPNEPPIPTSSISKFLDRFSLKKISSPLGKSPSFDEIVDYSKVSLSEKERNSQDLLHIYNLINWKPDIKDILDYEYTPQDAQLLNLKEGLYKSFSLQELSNFGNASDFHNKPFSLRLIFPTSQFVLVSYNARLYTTIFYKLNIARELSLDIDLRVPCPIDFCVPRRSRGSRNNRRTRRRIRASTSNSFSSLRSFGSNNANACTSGNLVSRMRTNSLLNDDLDDDDELDLTFMAQQEQEHSNRADATVQYQDQTQDHALNSGIPPHPVILEEDEVLSLLNDQILSLEPAQNVVSITSGVSSHTLSSTSVFSAAQVERSSTRITEFTDATTLSPISSRNESINIDTDNDVNYENTKLPIETDSNAEYRELVFAVRCIKSCKNKSKAWL